MTQDYPQLLKKSDKTPNQMYNLRPSKYYFFLFTAVMVSSFLIVFCLSIPLWMRLISIVFLGFYGWSILQRYILLRNKDAIILIKPQLDGFWLVKTNECEYVAELRGDSTVTSIISVLRFLVQGEKWPRSCMIFRDSLGSENYRKLLGEIVSSR